MGDEDATLGAVAEGLLAGSTAVLTATWASDFGAVAMLIDTV